MIYNRVASIAVDPIEKKPVYHYKPGSSVLSVGTVGCNLRCRHCQNWELSRSSRQNVNLRDISTHQLSRIALKTNSKGVSWTYNEPTIWFEYVIESAKNARENNLYTVMVTNGFIREKPLSELISYIDVYRVDIKAFSQNTFKIITGLSEVEIPMVSALQAKESGIHVEIVTNIITTINDTEDELRSIATFISEKLGNKTPWHITRFFPYLELSYLPPTPIQSLIRAKEIGKECGIDFIYIGNARERLEENTVCPRCDSVAIKRTGFEVYKVDVTEKGDCKTCGEYLNIYP
ncbi:MAG: Pyruvate formate-lyase 1-activating enzyme [candidate division WS2 bacterium]|nr:Pyruvate formate-lyase 1-activating enzyme [Candidatus Lithacetigena glycinireducens]MBT9174466.1 Pyruvate formate-lyase 1-activating enzyme [Candidatus Lithacetigena glycinireducens]